jgi:hypothetical protein
MVAAQEEDRLRRSKSYIKACKSYTDNLMSPPASLDKEVQTKAAEKANLSLEQYRALSSKYIDNETFRKVAFWIDVSHKMMRYEHGDLTNQRISIPTSKIYNLDGATTTYEEATEHLSTTTPYKVKFGSTT